MNIEKEIVSYLNEYGNTKESDIINYGIKISKCSPKEMKKVIKRMVVKNEIHYLVHSKLEPPETYVSLKEPLPPEITKILLEALVQMKAGNEDVQRILEEAASIAEHDIKKRQ